LRHIFKEFVKEYSSFNFFLGLGFCQPKEKGCSSPHSQVAHALHDGYGKLKPTTRRVRNENV
jgi:hypothetical protein